jgi:hypothetical protein
VEERLRGLLQKVGIDAIKKRHLLRNFILEMIVLSRQARDKHRESTQKKTRFRWA